LRCGYRGRGPRRLRLQLIGTLFKRHLDLRVVMDSCYHKGGLEGRGARLGLTKAWFTPGGDRRDWYVGLVARPKFQA
jgi:hypothetical protein